METKSKTGAIIGTIVTALLCGCPGLGLCLFGIVAATGIMPYTTSINDYGTTGMLPSWAGFAMICVSLILIAIPVVIGVLTLRKKPAPMPEPMPGEPLPPVS